MFPATAPCGPSVLLLFLPGPGCQTLVLSVRFKHLTGLGALQITAHVGTFKALSYLDQANPGTPAAQPPPERQDEGMLFTTFGPTARHRTTLLGNNWHKVSCVFDCSPECKKLKPLLCVQFVVSQGYGLARVVGGARCNTLHHDSLLQTLEQPSLC